MSAVRILATAAVSLTIQYGLAIAGWGGWSAFFAHAALQALVWVTLALVVLAAFSGGGMNTGEKEDRSNRWVLAAFTIIAMLMSYFSPYTDRIGFWTLDGDAARWAGVVICAAGGVLRILPVYVLKNRFSGLVAIQAGHTLETHGIYSVIRNPSYLGLMTTSFGWALAFRSGVGMLLAASLLVPLVARIRAEERLLREHFGAEYDAYCAHTWRLVPGIY
ncbi:MAG TPA: isoprenylcysteine carboxylmethyltransferase family protein [Terracidiphilus sp.]|jgi:protein-S-isoprenylcysteine O-methyltransferase Ste14|nr:isoprenylcysteine carboxylmethyltransferase family protein [Terracidiphilus sp.]